ncbi:MAG: hypothetical protein KJO41_06955 [Bacteroidia bacterium]|nr:hypothetical protein [Bacteroidia bacterium]NND25576.1 hypothetical protein [Flavobacteriaceae bacterium]MBT8278723.1 hypothetical protein [Bacteroidia bacterium]NNK60526.1 hypothetical protein [Flavobacteriaceae bacterium]NNL31998.1 hypothetical protein [Flavobacteriaceae bacterium]
MKPIKLRLLLMLTTLVLGLNAFAQEKAVEEQEKMWQMYAVHEDQVKPSMVMQYEQTAKMFADKMREHKIKDGGYLVTSSDDFRYLYVNPIEKFEEANDNPGMAELSEKMGEDAFGKMMAGFSPCYDKHGSYMIWLDKECTYMPEGITQTPEGQNYRKFYYIYFSPQNQGKIREAMMEVKALFAKKNSKTYYRVYWSGYGNMDSYIMVAVAAKDPVELEQRAAANDALLGEEAGPAFAKVMALALKMEEVTASIRPDLGYTPPKN